MRVHSAASYAETRLVVCALCRSCFHATDLFETHKAARHPNYEQDVDALSEYFDFRSVLQRSMSIVKLSDLCRVHSVQCAVRSVL